MTTLTATNASQRIRRGQAVELVGQSGRSVAGRYMGLIHTTQGVAAKLRGGRGAVYFMAATEIAEVNV